MKYYITPKGVSLRRKKIKHLKQKEWKAHKFHKRISKVEQIVGPQWTVCGDCWEVVKWGMVGLGLGCEMVDTNTPLFCSVSEKVSEKLTFERLWPFVGKWFICQWYYKADCRPMWDKNLRTLAQPFCATWDICSNLQQMFKLPASNF